MTRTDHHIALTLLKYYDLLIKEGTMKVLGQEVRHRKSDVYLHFTALTNGLWIRQNNIRFTGGWLIREQDTVLKIYLNTQNGVTKINVQGIIKKPIKYDSMGIV